MGADGKKLGEKIASYQGSRLTHYNRDLNGSTEEWAHIAREWVAQADDIIRAAAPIVALFEVAGQETEELMSAADRADMDDDCEFAYTLRSHAADLTSLASVEAAIRDLRQRGANIREASGGESLCPATVEACCRIIEAAVKGGEQ